MLRIKRTWGAKVKPNGPTGHEYAKTMILLRLCRTQGNNIVAAVVVIKTKLKRSGS